MIRSYPRETKTMVPVKVTVDGVVVTTNVSFCVVPDGDRPVTFTPATNLSDKIGPMIDHLTPGTHRIFAKVDSNPEMPEIDCGTIYIT